MEIIDVSLSVQSVSYADGLSDSRAWLTKCPRHTNTTQDSFAPKKYHPPEPVTLTIQRALAAMPISESTASVDAVLSQLAAVEALGPAWDGDDALPPDQQAIAQLRRLYGLVQRSNEPVGWPSVVPGVDGVVSLQYATTSRLAAFTCYPRSTVAYMLDRATGDNDVWRVDHEPGQVKEALGRFAAFLRDETT